MKTEDRARLVLEPNNRLENAWELDWPSLAPGLAHSVLSRQPDRVFTTSGTSGKPKVWHRTGEQLALELEVTAHLLRGEPDVVHATVKPTSLFGYVGAFIGAHLGIPTVFDEWGAAGTSLKGVRPLVFAVPASWRRLARTLADARLDRITIVHAGSILPTGLVKTVSELGHGDRGEILDLFGTTETGVIGSRWAFPTGELVWASMPDTRLEFADVDENGEARPTVTSRRIARCHGESHAGSVVLDDWLVPTSATTFGFKGRRERMVKPGGRAVDLDALEGQISTLVPGVDIACVPTEHPELGEHVEVLVAGPPDVAEAVIALLRARGASLSFVPGSARSVDQIQRSPMGKVRRVLPQTKEDTAA